MLAESAQRITTELADDAAVLDVGGWAQPFWRADWVIDLRPFATRPPGDGEGPVPRFAEERWVQRDICDREPWPFADRQFDFAVCSQTLEDIRDPVWVCSELNRVARAGYVEVPSRLAEQSFGVVGSFVGYSHHHWLCDVDERGISFVFKPHLLHAPGSDRLRFPAGFEGSLTPRQRVQTLWWEGGFGYRERIMLDEAELHSYLADYVAEHRSLVTLAPQRRLLGRRRR